MAEVDTGWAWVCLAASFLTLFIIAALDYSVGALQLALLEYYHDDVAKTSVIVVASVGSMFCTAPLAGFVVNATNCRISCVAGGILMFIGLVSSAFVDNLDLLLMTYGIIAGVGKSLSLVACFLSVGFNFSRLRTVASGIFATAGGLGVFTGSPVVRALLDYYGLHGTFLMLSAISLHVSLFGMLLRPTKLESGSRTSGSGEIHRRKSVVENQIYHFKGHVFNNMKVLKNLSFLVFGFCTFFWNLSLASITIHIQTFSHSTGVSTDNAANLMTVSGVGSTISRLLVGLSTSSSGLNGMVICMGQCAVIGVVTVLFPLYAVTYTGQLVYCFLQGLYTGGLYSQILPLTAELVDVHLLPPAMGLINFTIGAAWILGPYISGYILDSGGTYSHCFLLAGGCFLLAFVLVMVTVLVKSDVTVSDETRDITLETVPLSLHDVTVD